MQNIKMLFVGLGKTKMFMSRHQTAGQSNYIRVTNKSFEKESKLGSTLTDQNAFMRKLRAD
jgi:hypothetical protein